MTVVLSVAQSSDVPPEVLDALEHVVDPEIPVLTIRDLGILRDVRMEGGKVVVIITPTYSGCPAMIEIRDSIAATLSKSGYADVVIETQLSPAWTTDWMSKEGREKLRAFGIAPPEPEHSGAAQARDEDMKTPMGRNVEAQPLRVPSPRLVACPRCESHDTRLVSEFGSTACKAMYQCNACLEPFDYFKCH